MRFGIGQLVTHAMGWAGAFCYYEVAAFQPLGISLVDMYINFFCLSLQTHIRFSNVFSEHYISLLYIIDNLLIQSCINPTTSDYNTAAKLDTRILLK